MLPFMLIDALRAEALKLGYRDIEISAGSSRTTPR